MTISAGEKIFLHCEIVLCVGLGRWLWLWAVFWGAVAVCVAVCLLPSVGVSVALFGANKKRLPVWVSALVCGSVNTSILSTKKI